MSEQEQTRGSTGAIPPANAVSVYQSGDALDAFPVLKAFQQYVDAEQAKAHKRLMSVCIFFTVLLAAVVCGFIFVIAGMERGGGGGNDATVKALTELVAKMAQPQTKEAPAASAAVPAPVPAAPAVQTAPAPAAAGIDFEAQKRNIELQAKLQALETEKRLREEFAAKLSASAPAEATPDEKRLQQEARRQRAREKSLREREEQIAADERRLRERELELHRRKLYPEYYERLDAQKAGAPVVMPPARPVQPVKPVQTVQPVQPVQTVQPVQSVQTVQTAQPARSAQPQVTPQSPQTIDAKAPAKNDDFDLSIFDNLDLSDGGTPAATNAAPKTAPAPGAAADAAKAKKTDAGKWSVPLQ